MGFSTVGLPLIVHCLLASQWTHAELYTALADLEDLLQTEAMLLKTLEDYIVQQEIKLAMLKK
jgi:prolyl 4-hydroxylase